MASFGVLIEASPSYLFQTEGTCFSLHYFVESVMDFLPIAFPFLGLGSRVLVPLNWGSVLPVPFLPGEENIRLPYWMWSGQLIFMIYRYLPFGWRCLSPMSLAGCDGRFLYLLQHSSFSWLGGTMRHSVRPKYRLTERVEHNKRKKWYYLSF